MNRQGQRASTWLTVGLRQFIGEHTGELRDVHKPGPDTLAYQAPGLFIPSHVNIMQKAKHDAEILRIREDQLEQLDPKPHISTEGDVVKESCASYVDWASLVFSETTGLKIKTMAEETIPNESRFDLIWFMVLPGKTEDDAANWLKFAVLEYKNTRMIDPGAFRKAIYRESTGTSKSGTSRRAGVLKNETLIDDKSALWLTKQMTKYAKTLQVPYQIAFDFGTMLTMEYGNDLAAGPDVDPKNVQIAHMSREDEVPGTEMTVRAFLHGFLDKALRGTMEQHRIEAPWKP